MPRSCDVSNDEQKQRLQSLLRSASRKDDSCNFGAMLFMESPGDVCFLAPVFPEFRGFEIVSASPKRADGRDYDLWYRADKLIQSNMTASEVIDWLKQHVKSDSNVTANIAQWAEEVIAYYKINKRV